MKATTAIAAAWTRGWCIKISDNEGYLLGYRHLEDAFERLKNHKGEDTIEFGHIKTKTIFNLVIKDGKVVEPNGYIKRMMKNSIH